MTGDAWAAGWTDANNVTYTELKSINGKGSGLIVTDFKPAGTEIVKFKYKPSTVDGNECVFCSRYYYSGNPQAQFCGFRIAKNFRFDRCNYISSSSRGHSTCNTTTLAAGTEYSVVANFGGAAQGIITINDTAQTLSAAMKTDSDSYAPGSVLVLLASHDNKQDVTPTSFGNKATGDLYYFQLWNADGVTLEHDFRPAKSEDGVVGLYDTVKEKFYPATAGEFFGVEESSVATATWTGKAGNGNFSDSGNWECYDAAGNSLAEAVPGSETRITLGADVPDTGLSEIPASFVGTIDLVGHRLVVSGASEFAFSVTDSSVDKENPGELRITVPEGVIFNKTAAFGITGNLSLVKDGAGMLLWNGGTLAAEIPVTVESGVFKLDVTTENVFGNGGKITVMAGAQFDINTTLSDGQLRLRTFYIEGEGSDGSGALVNSAISTTAGRQINKIVLTGDATIGGSGYIDIRDKGNGVDCGEHKLTVKNTGSGRVVIFDGAFLDNATDIVVSGGNLLFGNASGKDISKLGAERIVLENGGVFTNYKDNTYTEYDVPFVVDKGECKIENSNLCENGSYRILASITLKSNSTLILPSAARYICAFTNEVFATLKIETDKAIFKTYSNCFRNDGEIYHTGGILEFGNTESGSSEACILENNGKIVTSGKTFKITDNSAMIGAGTLELAGGSLQVLGDLSGFTGKIILSGGTATVSSSFGSFAGTLVLKGGAFKEADSLADFKGTVVVDLSGRKDALDVDGKNWFGCKEIKEILVDLGERELEYGDKVLSWTEKPDEVRFRLLGDRKAVLRKKDDGLVYSKWPGLVLIVK